MAVIDIAKTQQEAGAVRAMLKRRGLPTDLGAAIAMLARTIRDHKHLETLLTQTGPEDRQELYESIRPYLRFVPKPLDVYIASVGQRAEREQWPVQDEYGKLRAFKPAQDVATAQKAMAAALAERTLTLTCSKCLKREKFHAIGNETNVDVVQKARKSGWVYDYLAVPAREICPSCPTSLRKTDA